MTTTRDTIHTIINDKPIFDKLVDLQTRWQEESEHENFADYEINLKAFLHDRLPQQVFFVKATRRPFGFDIKIGGEKWRCHLKTKGRFLVFGAKPLKTPKRQPNKKPHRNDRGILELRVKRDGFFDKINGTESKVPKSEKECMDFLAKLFWDLEPENLSCDGEASISSMRNAKCEIMACWRAVESILGRQVSHDQAGDYALEQARKS